MKNWKGLGMLLFCRLLLGLVGCANKGNEEQGEVFIEEEKTPVQTETASREEKPLMAWTYGGFELREQSLIWESQQTSQEKDIAVEWVMDYSQGLKGSVSQDINMLVDAQAREMVQKTVDEFDFDQFSKQQGISDTDYKKKVFLYNTISYLGSFACIHIEVNVAIEQEEEQYYYEQQIGDDFSRFVLYDLKNNRQGVASDLFLPGVDYMAVINDGFENWMQANAFYWSQEDILKRPFTGFLAEDVQIGLYAFLTEKFQPSILVQPRSGNPFVTENISFQIPIVDVEALLSFSVNDLENVVEQPEKLKRMLISRNLPLEPYDGIQANGFTNTKFVCLQNHDHLESIERLNENLCQWQKEFVENSPLLQWVDKADDDSHMKVERVTFVGPFLNIEIYGILSMDDQYQNDTSQAVFLIETGEQMKIRDLLRTDAIDKLTPNQKQYLDSTEFTVDVTGSILYEDVENNLFVTLPPEYFDFEKYRYFNIGKQ